MTSLTEDLSGLTMAATPSMCVYKELPVEGSWSETKTWEEEEEEEEEE